MIAVHHRIRNDGSAENLGLLKEWQAVCIRVAEVIFKPYAENLASERIFRRCVRKFKRWYDTAYCHYWVQVSVVPIREYTIRFETLDGKVIAIFDVPSGDFTFVCE